MLKISNISIQGRELSKALDRCFSLFIYPLNVLTFSLFVLIVFEASLIFGLRYFDRRFYSLLVYLQQILIGFLSFLVHCYIIQPQFLIF